MPPFSGVTQPNDYVYNFLTHLNRYAPKRLRNPRSKEHPDGELKPIPGRDFSIDAAWEDVRVAVEIDGGNYLARKSPKTGRWVCVGRHTQSADYEKLCLLVLCDWAVLRYTPQMLKADPQLCIAQVVELIVQRETAMMDAALDKENNVH